ncbi:MAG: CHASE2 domain-containing protein [Candidatus Eremiobacteraeota bacterium]|nr:CHASE2 domain-containing protein [Candidatus Eremiobacteraeota bacterium]
MATPFALVRRLAAAWRGASPRKRHFAKNVAIGLVISIGLSFAESNAVVAKLRDAILSMQVAQFGGTGVAPDVLWLDVDEATYRRWHAPPVTPRDRICRLIDFAVRGSARVVVVDIDVTRPSSSSAFPPLESCSPASGPVGRAARTADDELNEYLHRHARACHAGAHGHCTPIVLTRELRTSFQSAYADGAAARVPRESFIENVPLGRDAAVVWSAPNFDFDDDAIIRRWRLWEPVCDPPAVVGSTELLAAGLFAGRRVGDLQTALDELTPQCVSNHAAAPAASPRREVDLDIGYRLHLTTDSLERRFFYRIAWDAARGRPSMAAFVPAHLITEADPQHPFDPAIAAGRVVVIGGSYADNPDFHRTPLGTMPGSLVLINAIEALITDDHVRESPWWLRILVEAVLVAFVAGLFLYLRPQRAMLASSVLVAGLAMTAGYLFLDRGYWIDPVLPLVGIQLHELLAIIEHRAKTEGTS